jgi:hypothetical protein
MEHDHLLEMLNRLKLSKREPISVLDVCGSWLRRSSVATEFVDGH